MLSLIIIIKLLKSNNYFVISLSYNLIIRFTIFSLRNLIFINSIILAIRKLLVYRLIIAIIFLLNNR